MIFRPCDLTAAASASAALLQMEPVFGGIMVHFAGRGKSAGKFRMVGGIREELGFQAHGGVGRIAFSALARHGAGAVGGKKLYARLISVNIHRIPVFGEDRDATRLMVPSQLLTT